MKLYKENSIEMLEKRAKVETDSVRWVSNTNAVNTVTNTDQIHKANDTNDLQALVDWFACTFDKEQYSIDNVFSLLLKYFDLPSSSHIDKSDLYNEKNTTWRINEAVENGYYSSLTYGSISVFYDDYGKGKKGYKLRFSGQGCRQAELLFKNGYNWFDFFEEILEYNTNITRIDLAVDDKKGIFTVSDLINMADNGFMVTKFKDYQVYRKGKAVDGKNMGKTLEVGAARSRIRIRFYEKNHERANKLFDEEIRKTVWNRTELEIKETRARQTVEELVKGKQEENNIGIIALGIINQYVKFCKKEQNESNRSRWEITEEWNTFLNGVKKIKLYEAAPETDIETKKAWIWRQIPKTLAQLIISESDYNDIDINYLRENPEYLINLVSYGLNKLELKDYKLIEQHRELQNKKSHSAKWQKIEKYKKMSKI